MSDLKVKEGEIIGAQKFNGIVDFLLSLGPPDAHNRRSHNAVFMTPTDGIPGRSGTTMGEAECQRCFFEGTTIDTATGEIEFILNLSETEVAGDTYIQCVWVDGRWLVNWEDCGA